MATQTIIIPAKSRKVSLLKKVLSIVIFLCVFYVAPLCFQPRLLLSWEVLFLAAIFTVLFATQPRISLDEAKNKRSTDRNTIWLIVIVSGLGQIFSLIEWAYFKTCIYGKLILPLSYEVVIREASHQFWLTASGAVLLIGGTCFRLYAIFTLRNYFSATVQIKPNHKLIYTGPYKYLRHPSYTGAYFAMIGCALFLHSLIGALVFGIGMLIVYNRRISAEEKVLRKKFGIYYVLFATKRWRMIPMIW